VSIVPPALNTITASSVTAPNLSVPGSLPNASGVTPPNSSVPSVPSSSGVTPPGSSGGTASGVTPPSGGGVTVTPLDYLAADGKTCISSPIGTKEGSGCNPKDLNEQAEKLKADIDKQVDAQEKAAKRAELAKVLANLTDLKYYGRDGVSAYKAVVDILESQSYQDQDVFFKVKLWMGINSKLASGKWNGRDLKRKAEQFKKSDANRISKANDSFSSLSVLTTIAYGLQGADTAFSLEGAFGKLVSNGTMQSLQNSANAGSTLAIQVLDKLDETPIKGTSAQGIRFGTRFFNFFSQEVESVTVGGFKLPISVLGMIGIALSAAQLSINVIDVWSGSSGNFNCRSNLSKVVGTAIQVSHTTTDVLFGLGAGVAGATFAGWASAGLVGLGYGSIAGPVGAFGGFAVGMVLFLIADQSTNFVFDRGLMKFAGC
jgi:hypothetical protein